MYNLLMVASDGYWDERSNSSFEYDRFLSYTHEAIKSRLLPLSDDAIAQILGMPALFAYEFGRDPNPDDPVSVRVGKLVSLKRRQREVEFEYVVDVGIAPISSAQLRAFARELDIDIARNENYRTHWAVKDVDLFAVLKKEGLIEPAPAAIEINEALRTIAADVPKPSGVKPKVFIVHGRNDGLKEEVGRWLGKIGLDDIILHEQANAGRTLITKFEEVARDVDYAVVLMTPDDVGGLPGDDQRYRARQNVIFELGYFIGKLGAGRVAAIVVGDIEKPSDYDGVVYIPRDSAGAWKIQLAREFKALKLPFDLMAAL